MTQNVGMLPPTAQFNNEQPTQKISMNNMTNNGLLSKTYKNVSN